MGRLITDETLAIITIYQEAAGEPFEGKVAVAEVIRNRMRERYMSDGTVSGTVLRAYQFSGWNTDAGKIRLNSLRLDTDEPMVKECQRAWHEALRGSSLVKDAVLYLNPEMVLQRVGRLPAWAYSRTDPTKVDVTRVVTSIGRHVFLQD